VFLQAERQAVNTTVQGSGADLVKTAMIMIDRELAKHYPDTIKGHKHLHALSSGMSALQLRNFVELLVFKKG